MIPDWPSLKARGGPWPEGLETPAETGLAHMAEPGEMFIYAAIVDEGVRGRVAISPEHAAALCCDAAVRWLPTTGPYREVRIVAPSRLGMSWRVEVYTIMAGGEPDVFEAGAESAESLDIALRITCGAILDSKKETVP